MTDFEKDIKQAVEDKVVAGCVLHAVNRDVPNNGTPKPLDPSSIMWIASCTKLMTSICALQFVERGLVTLDEPVYTYIPELKDFPLIIDFKEDGLPVTEPHKGIITLRTLLTHTSGLSYEETHPSLFAWNAYYKLEVSREPTLVKRYSKPMCFEPGTGWVYGPSTDFAGLLIERITNQRLEDYMRTNLWQPLGIKDMTFTLAARPDLRARLIGMSERDLEKGTLSLREAPLSWHTPDGGEITDHLGGQGVFGSPEEYIKVLYALLVSDENEKILKKETVELFFTPQLNEASKTMLNFTLDSDWARNAMGGPPKDMVKDWALGGLLFGDDEAGGRTKGTMVWGGLPNLIWFIDRKTGLTGLYASQLVPTGDAQSAALIRKFEIGVYELFHQQQKKTQVKI